MFIGGIESSTACVDCVHVWRAVQQRTKNAMFSTSMQTLSVLFGLIASFLFTPVSRGRPSCYDAAEPVRVSLSPSLF